MTDLTVDPDDAWSTCPGCGEPVLLASLLNHRNGKWTVIGLDHRPGEFEVITRGAVAVDLGNRVVGPYPVAVHEPGRARGYAPHPPSHWELQPVYAEPTDER
jgi:hypothetical protein